MRRLILVLGMMVFLTGCSKQVAYEAVPIETETETETIQELIIIECETETETETETDEVFEHEYSEIFKSMTEDEWIELGALVQLEAEGIGAEAQMAVIETVMNRVLSASYPNTVHEVIFQKKGKCREFTPSNKIKDITPDYKYRELIKYVEINGRTVLPSTAYLYFSTDYHLQEEYAENFIKLGNKNGAQYYGTTKK